jgi:phage FluMu protein Com
MADQNATEVRCPKCHKLFFKLLGGAAQVEVLCPRCKGLVVVTAGNQQQPEPLGAVVAALHGRKPDP